jgi:hypothetical protein
VLQAKCIGCHGATQMSGLDLRTREAMARGGKRGPAMALIGKAVRREGELQMPPGKTPLTPAEIQTLTEWIAAGAGYPKAARPAQETWWSFQPVPPPKPGRIDQFVHAKLKEKKLRPLPAADKRVPCRFVGRRVCQAD